VAAIVETVRQEFGIHRKVSVKLYKLLIYETGSFFAPHRDSEKTPGMFATLVVCLPSRHEGGTLVVRHEGQTKKIDFGGGDAEFKTQYAAFYTDCQHEIMPVTAGYRICLVYNLAIVGKKQQPSAPDSATAVEQAAHLLGEVFADASGKPSKLAIPFEHQYTEAGLDPKHLKGSDRARADVLVRAAESLGCQCYLALLTHHQSGEVDYDTWDCDDRWGRGSHRWSYGDYDEDEDAEDGDDSGSEMGEVYEEELSLDHWLDPQGRKQPFGVMHLNDDELLNPEDTAGWAMHQEIHEATGNEGVSMERWYRQVVLVIWPRDRYFRVLASEGQASAIPALERMAVRSKKPTALTACRTFAEEIIDHWRPREQSGAEASYPGRMLKLLERIGSEELVGRFLRDVLPKDFDGSEGKALHRLCQRFGWETCGAALHHFLAQQKPEDPYARLDQIVSICEPLCCDPPVLTAERRTVCAALADALARVIQSWDTGSKIARYRREESRAGDVASAVRIFSTVAATDQRDQFLAHVLADRRHYDLQQVLIPDVKAIHKWLPKVSAAQPAASRLLQHCLAELRAATAHPIEPPKDWARDAELGCKCQDCQALSRFLRDPAQRVGRFPVRKERRRHLHQQIEAHQCDLSHMTERVGSPQTLVCTKTQASYERRLQQCKVDKELLAELDALAGGERRAPISRSRSGRALKK
jgi:hypothetical protein